MLLVGFVPYMLTSYAEFAPGGAIVLVEEPDVVRKRDVRTAAAACPVPCELIEWTYQLPGAAEDFIAAHPDLRPGAATPMSEYATPFAARLAEHYAVPGAGVRAADAMRDKEILRSVTRTAGIANPESEPVSGPDDVRAFMAAHPGPVVLKPANRQGSIGTRVLHDADEADQAWAECTVHDEGVMVPDRPMPLRMLAERCVRGDEFSVELLVDRGRTLFANVTGKHLFPGPYPIELGHEVPAAIPAELDALLRKETERVLATVGFGSGVVHCEWIVADGVPHLVECAGRFAGDGITLLIEMAYPVALIDAFWALMSNAPLPPLPATPAKGAAARFLRADPGTVAAIDGLDAANAVPHVTWCGVGIGPGDQIRPLHSSWDRIGSAMALAPTATAAMAAATEALAHVHITLEPPEPGPP